MAKVTWTFQALQDLDEIAEYHAQYSEKYASLLIDSFFEQTERLEQFPYSGRIVQEANISSIREVVTGKYRIIYSVPNSDEVNILTVRSSSLPLEDISSGEDA